MLLVALAVGWFYDWTARGSGDPWRFGEEQRDYFNWLIDGWLDGQLHMKVEVPAALLQLDDPYDPRQRPPDLGLHDASLHDGKYYVYFGVAPMVLLMLPFRLLTGIDLPLAAAVLVFTYGGFLAGSALWLALRRRYFADTPPWMSAVAVAVLGVAGLGPVLLRRPHMWELPIAGGYCFAMLTLGCVFASLHDDRRRRLWFALAGLCLGLAIASRPTYLLASPLLAVPLIAWRRSGAGWPWREAVAAALPLTGIGALMAWHNYARFGNPFEFGQAYQLSFDYESKVRHFSPGYVPFNGWRYFFSVAEWSRYFPFIAPAELPPKPPGFSGHDDVYGVLTNLPVAWLALAAPLALWRRDAEARRRLAAWLGAAAVLFVVMAGVLLGFFGSLARYQLDFTPTLMLLAAIGLAALERLLRLRGVVLLQWVARVAWIGAALASIGFGVLFSLQLDNRLPERNPRAARAAAELLNHVPAFFERLGGVEHGPLEFEFRAPATLDREHTLVTTGDARHGDRVFLRPAEGDRVELVVAPAGLAPIASRPLALDRAQPHRLRVTLGALLPPDTHPFFRDKKPAVVDVLTRQLRVELDGEVVIDERRRFVRQSSGVRAGAGVTAMRRLPAAALATEQPVALLRLRTTFPERPAAPREPLVTAGGTVLFVDYGGGADRLAFGSLLDGVASAPGDAVAVERGRTHEVVARWWPTADPGRRRAEVRLDGTIVWSREVAWSERSPVIAETRNVDREPGCADRFTGNVTQVEITDGREFFGAGNSFWMRVRLPPGRAGAREPLVVTGRTGAGDFVLIEYLEGRVRFGLDHWGAGTLFSEPVAVDRARPHDLEIALSSLAAPRAGEADSHVRKGRVRVWLDGALAWDQPAPLFRVAADEVAIGRNPIGGTSTAAAFSGDLLAVERIPRE